VRDMSAGADVFEVLAMASRLEITLGEPADKPHI
jgi:hypothetical protein